MVADKVFDILPSNLPKVVGELPSTRESAVAIVEYDSASNVLYFGIKESLTHPVFKIVIRDSSYATGRETAELVKETLNKYMDSYFQSILIVGSPMYLGRDELRSHIFQLTFISQIKE